MRETARNRIMRSFGLRTGERTMLFYGVFDWGASLDRWARAIEDRIQELLVIAK